MRTFDVTVKGTVHVVRANDFIRPRESLSREWIFIDPDGEPLWTFAEADVTSVVEAVDHVKG